MLETIGTGVANDTPDLRPLDQIIGSRSHVRVLRAMMSSEPGVNLGLRDVARAAGVSHTRTARVLSELAVCGFVERHETRWGPIFELNDEHFIGPALWMLFDEEMHFLQEIEGFVRGEIRKEKRLMKVEIKPGVDRDLRVEVKSRGAPRLDDRRWFDRLEKEIHRRFGVQVRVAPPNPDEWMFHL